MHTHTNEQADFGLNAQRLYTN